MLFLRICEVAQKSAVEMIKISTALCWNPFLQAFILVPVHLNLTALARE
ncbi:regulator of ribonuclease activity A [Aggregatibacter aphrophilus NJ8700]|nr:regulator of ribonuclease activity A [Aggregatibacter aphrophilus NJ8700]